MTTPSLTSDGYMHWPPRAWAESLCTPLPDGTWLIQAPIAISEKPLLYILPDAKAMEHYLARATRLIWIRAAIRALFHPYMAAAIFWIFFISANFLAPLWALRVAMGMLAIGPLGELARRTAERSVFAWLSEHSIQPHAGLKRPPILIRTVEEWEGLYLSIGRRIDQLANIIVLGAATSLILWAAAIYMSVCRGISSLDGAVPSLAGWRSEAYAAGCSADSGWIASANLSANLWVILLLVVALGFMILTFRTAERRRYAGRAVPVTELR